MRRLRAVLILAAGICLVLGILLPIMQLQRLYFFTETPSVIDLLLGLWGEGEWALALLIALFSVLIPFVKLALLALTQFGDPNADNRIARVLPHLSKWSMIDVMLVAIAIFAAKSSGLAVAVVQPGLWFYAASAMIVGVLMPLSSRPRT